MINHQKPPGKSLNPANAASRVIALLMIPYAILQFTVFAFLMILKSDFSPYWSYILKTKRTLAFRMSYSYPYQSHTFTHTHTHSPTSQTRTGVKTTRKHLKLCREPTLQHIERAVQIDSKSWKYEQQQQLGTVKRETGHSLLLLSPLGLAPLTFDESPGIPDVNATNTDELAVLKKTGRNLFRKWMPCHNLNICMGLPRGKYHSRKMWIVVNIGE